MRIRNRSQSFSAPLSSSLSPDLSLNPVTRHQREEGHKEQEDEAEEKKVHLNRNNKQLHQSYYSDHSLPPANEDRSPSNKEDQFRQVNGQIYERGCRNYIKSSVCMLPQEDFTIVEEKEGDGKEILSARDKRSKNSGAQTAELLLSSQVGVRWSEGESAFPLKKRKKKYEFMIAGSEEKKKKKKKGLDDDDDDDDDDEENEAANVSNRVIKVKKMKNNNGKSSILEGSRCSRVNGRGWRCCQATLVGYSLCEHHLGKGRLKSINHNLRCSSPATGSKRIGLTDHKKKKLLSEQVLHEEDDDEEEEDKKKKKKKNAGGIVKARSISSLLEQMQEASGYRSGVASAVVAVRL